MKDSLETRLNQALAPLPRRVLVGVSGGLDSVALLQALAASGRRPVVLHFDHRARRESGADARFVQQLAKSLGLRCILGKMPQAKAGAPLQETRARAARMEFFQKAAHGLRCYDLVLAHHADDQVETLLLQLLRGTGSGWQGMAAAAVHGKLRVHRPLLDFWKEELRELLRAKKIPWREDASNDDVRHDRNWIRRALLPQLRRRFGSSVDERLRRTALVQARTREWADALCAPLARRPRLAAKELRALPEAQRARVLALWLGARGVPDVGFELVQEALRLLDIRAPAKLNLPGGSFLRRRAGELWVEGR